MSSERVSLLRIGTRKSALALTQTNMIMEKLRELDPSLRVEVVTLDTKGDQQLDLALHKIGGKGLFTKELEDCLFAGGCDCVVHSLKDMPTTLPDGLSLATVCEQDSVDDVAVFRHSSPYKRLSELPADSVVGTSSNRRLAQLTAHYPQLKYEVIRGNLQTRLRKLDDMNGIYSATILASAGLRRSQLGHRIGQILGEDETGWLRAVGQGALAIECKSDAFPIIKLLQRLSDPEVALKVIAERAFLRVFQGGCSIPVGVNCNVVPTEEGKMLAITGGIFSLDGSTNRIESISAKLPDFRPFVVKDEVDRHQHSFSAILQAVVEPQDSPFGVAERTGEALGLSVIQHGGGAIMQSVLDETR